MELAAQRHLTMQTQVTIYKQVHTGATTATVLRLCLPNDADTFTDTFHRSIVGYQSCGRQGSNQRAQMCMCSQHAPLHILIPEFDVACTCSQSLILCAQFTMQAPQAGNGHHSEGSRGRALVPAAALRASLASCTVRASAAAVSDACRPRSRTPRWSSCVMMLFTSSGVRNVMVALSLAACTTLSPARPNQYCTCARSRPRGSRLQTRPPVR